MFSPRKRNYNYMSDKKRMKFCHLQQHGFWDIMLSEISQTEKDKYCICVHVKVGSVLSDSLQPHGL